MSNMSSSWFHLDQMYWRSVEHFYQAAKFLDPASREVIRSADTAFAAMKLGRKKHTSVRDDWDRIRCDCMERALYAKFRQNSELQDRLLKTGERELIENSNNSFWGRGEDGKGENQLGRLLMRVRSKLREEPDSVRIDAVKDFADQLVFKKFLDIPAKPPQIHQKIVEELKCAVLGMLTPDILVANLDRSVDSCSLEFKRGAQHHSVWISQGDFELFGDATPSAIHWLGPAAEQHESQPFISVCITPVGIGDAGALVRLESAGAYLHLRWLGDDTCVSISATAGTDVQDPPSVVGSDEAVQERFVEMIGRIQSSVAAV